MGFMFRVRLSSFFAGAATASIAGFYFLYKDYMLAHQAISQQVEGAYGSLEERIEILNRRINEIEKLKLESSIPLENTDGCSVLENECPAILENHRSETASIHQPMEVLCFHAPSLFNPRPSGMRRRSKAEVAVRSAKAVPAPMGEKTEYRDGFFEKAFMGLFARKMERFASGGKSRRGIWEWDYESFVDVSKRVMVGRSRKQQEEVVREVLLSMLPSGAPAQFRKLFPPTKWAAEFNAALTVPFFHWLVGPSEVIEVEVNGTKQRSGVHIKKCRYLENSGCVGMCVNMCKLPTQDFFTNEFGLPLTMNPNFEDMSCDMVYGQPPPPFEEDPVSKQPCYSNICSLGNPNSPVCHKLQN
ncbi:hypothetical protein HPP92_026128 [Vanilla planifolia]|uniref:Beta-carotene isomerase D27-like C-terminal domain-containing protein n=1 Tax=Vanilla planifolia TaxID=51239 RepID=A0A835PDA4_VANPL|nr:hypothetical protein HPP92_026128 [Vanilla planifolia]